METPILSDTDIKDALHSWIRSRLDSCGLFKLRVDVSCRVERDPCGDDESFNRFFMVSLLNANSEIVCFRKQGVQRQPGGFMDLRQGDIKNYGDHYPGLGTLLMYWTENFFHKKCGAKKSEILAGYERGPGTWFQYGYVPTWGETLAFKSYLKDAWTRTQTNLVECGLALKSEDADRFHNALQGLSMHKYITQGRRQVLQQVFSHVASVYVREEGETVNLHEHLMRSGLATPFAKRLMHGLKDTPVASGSFPIGKVVFENLTDTWFGVLMFSDPVAAALRDQAATRAMRRLFTARHGVFDSSC